MKDLREMFDALLDGETLQLNDGSRKELKINKEGFLEGFSCMNKIIPYVWEIKQKPQWYDNIPECGVLCWCETYHTKDVIISLISEYIEEIEFPFRQKDNNNGFILATPLTKTDVAKFYNIANDIENMDD